MFFLRILLLSIGGNRTSDLPSAFKCPQTSLPTLGRNTSFEEVRPQRDGIDRNFCRRTIEKIVCFEKNYFTFHWISLSSPLAKSRIRKVGRTAQLEGRRSCRGLRHPLLPLPGLTWTGLVRQTQVHPLPPSAAASSQLSFKMATAIQIQENWRPPLRECESKIILRFSDSQIFEPLVKIKTLWKLTVLDSWVI